MISLKGFDGECLLKHYMLRRKRNGCELQVKQRGPLAQPQTSELLMLIIITSTLSILYLSVIKKKQISLLRYIDIYTNFIYMHISNGVNITNMLLFNRSNCTSLF